MTKILIDEATVKQALEGLVRMKRYGNTFGYRSHEQNPYEQVCEAITALKALVEQPAPRVVDCHVTGVCVQSGLWAEKPALMQEQVAAELERIAQEPPVNGNNLAQARVLMAAQRIRSASTAAQQQSCYCLNCEELSKQVTALKLCLEVERGFNAQEQPAQGEKK